MYHKGTKDTEMPNLLEQSYLGREAGGCTTTRSRMYHKGTKDTEMPNLLLEQSYPGREEESRLQPANTTVVTSFAERLPPITPLNPPASGGRLAP